MGAGGRVLQITEYRYDPLGRLDRVSVNGAVQVAYDYDAESLQLVSKAFLNGIRITYQQDERGRLAGMLAYDAFGNPVKGVAYEWNQQGQLVKRTFQGFQFAKEVNGYTLVSMSVRNEGAALPKLRSADSAFEYIEQYYQYDSLGRLLSVVSSERPELSERYVYDASGNITEKTIGSDTVRMTYDKANQIVSLQDARGLRRFEYDSAGRMIRETLNGEPVANFTYGYLDKVTSVTRLRAGSATDGQARGGEEAHFHYNASGMLVGKSKSHSAGSGQVGQRLELWQWDGLALVARGDEAYINEGHVSGASALISRSLSEGDERYLLTDYLGTTLAAFDAEGDRNDPTEATAWNYTRTSFGAGSDSPEVMARFTGKPYDVDLGAYVFPYRNYRSDIGRWMSADPIGFPDGPNQHFYAPVPTMGVDPLGLQQETQKWIYGEYTWMAQWSEIREQSLNASFSVSFPAGVTVSVSPGLQWEKVGDITYSKSAGEQPTETAAPNGWSWVPETITYVEVIENSQPTYGANYEVFSHREFNHHGYIDVYNTYRDGSLSVVFKWKRLAEEN